LSSTEQKWLQITYTEKLVNPVDDDAFAHEEGAFHHSDIIP
jgi:hypothetical protein